VLRRRGLAREVCLAPWSWICYSTGDWPVESFSYSSRLTSPGYFTGQHVSISECQRLTLSFTGQLFSFFSFVMLKKRLAQNFGANLFAQFTNVLVQLASVPFNFSKRI
jgi:hypothetical protein